MHEPPDGFLELPTQRLPAGPYTRRWEWSRDTMRITLMALIPFRNAPGFWTACCRRGRGHGSTIFMYKVGSYEEAMGWCTTEILKGDDDGA